MNEQPFYGQPFFYDTRNFPLDRAKAFFARIGVAIVLQRVIWIVLANVMAIVTARVAPEIYKTWWFPWLYNDLPHYLIAIPICYLILPKKIDTDAYIFEVEPEELSEQKPKFGIGKAIIALIISFSALYLFAQVGSTVNDFFNLISGGILGNNNALGDLLDDTPWYVTVLGTCILAPLMEEIVFRKWIIDRARPFGEFASCLLSGLMFGLFHGNFLQGFYATALGFIFAYVYIRTSNIWYTIVLHSIINLFGSIIMPALVSSENINKINLIVNEGIVNSETLTALIVVLAAEILTFATVIAGIVLFLVFVKKLVFKKPPLLDTGEKPLKLMFGNVGVIAALIVFSVSFIIALL